MSFVFNFNLGFFLLVNVRLFDFKVDFFYFIGIVYDFNFVKVRFKVVEYGASFF